MRSFSVWMALGVALLATSVVAQTALPISGVVADPAQNTITVNGTDFDPANIAVYVGADLAELRRARVITATRTAVAARLPAQQPGTYVVGVSSGSRSATTTYTLTQATTGATGDAEASILFLASQFVAGGLRLIGDYALPLLLAFAGVGVLTMALLQTVKDLYPLRRRFHQAQIASWLSGRKGGTEEATLIELAAAGDSAALFELPVAGMMGQLTMASRIVLLFPGQYERLLRVMAGDTSARDIETILAGAEGRASADDVERARVRVGHMIERTIDALQVSISSKWERRNKISAFVLSMLVTAASFWLYFYATDQPARPLLGRLLALGFVTSLLGGFLAPVAKDLVTALQNLRKP